MTEIVKAGENLFLALGFPPHEAEILQLRAELMGHLRRWREDRHRQGGHPVARLTGYVGAMIPPPALFARQ